MIKLLKKRWSDILIGIILLLMLIPQTRKPIQVYLQKIIAMSPSINQEDELFKIQDYNLTFSDKVGEIYQLNDAKGEVVIINFWATWCPPCIAEMPMFQALFNDYGDRVKFYFITQDDWSLVEKFQEKRKLNLPVFILEKPSSSLKYTSLPTTYLINKKGEILVEKVGVADWNSKEVRTLLNQALQK